MPPLHYSIPIALIKMVTKSKFLVPVASASPACPAAVKAKEEKVSSKKNTSTMEKTIKKQLRTQPRPLLFYNHCNSAHRTKINDAKFQHDSLIQLCSHEGCRNVAIFKQGYGFCHVHQKQKESIGNDIEQRQDNSEGRGDENVEINVEINQTTSYEALCNAIEQSSSTNVETKHDRPSEDPLAGTKAKETKRQKITIGLSDVPKQPPISKVGKHEGASKYTGVQWRKEYKRWVAKIRIDAYQLGTFKNEEDAASLDAAAEYARAVFKYNKRKRL